MPFMHALRSLLHDSASEDKVAHVFHELGTP
jgi:hypothetical protein